MIIVYAVSIQPQAWWKAKNYFSKAEFFCGESQGFAPES